MRVSLCEGDDTVLTKCAECQRYCLNHGKTAEDWDVTWLRHPDIRGAWCHSKMQRFADQPHMTPRVEERKE